MTLIHTILLPFALLAASVLGDGWLGVTLADKDRPTISQVIPNSPAQKAGLKHGDVILSLNGKKLPSVDAMFERFQELNAGEVITLGIQRGSKKFEKKIRLAQRPVEGRKPAKDTAKQNVKGERRVQGRGPAPKPGRETQKKDQPSRTRRSNKPAFLGVRFTNIDSGDGVRVTDVIKGAAAVKAGVQRGDLICCINGKKIADMDGFKKAMQHVRAHDVVELDLLHRGKRKVIKVKLGEWPKDVSREPQIREVIEERPLPKRAPVKKAAKKAPAKKTTAPRTTARTKLGYSSSLERTLKTAVAVRRPTIAIFGASWCVNCETLKKSLAHESLNKLMGQYARVWIDTDKQSKLADRFDVERLPHIVLFDASGKKHKTIIGYQPPAVMAKALSALRPKQDRVEIVEVPEPRRRRLPAVNRSTQAEIQRLRAEVQRLRAQQQRLEQQMRQLQAELRRRRK